MTRIEKLVGLGALLSAVCAIAATGTPTPVASPVLSAPTGGNGCDHCVATPGGVMTVTVIPPVAYGPCMVTKISNGTCAVDDSDGCHQTAPCKFRGNYEIGTPVVGGNGPFQSNQIPPRNSVIVAGFHVIQSFEDFNGQCGVNGANTVVDFTTIGPPRVPMASIKFDGDCSVCQ